MKLNMSDIGGTVISTSTSMDSLFPKPFMKWKMMFPGPDGTPAAGIIIESARDMKTLMSGIAVYVNWYRIVNDEWVYVERSPFQFKFKGENK